MIHRSLRRLARELDWPQREGRGARLPSIKWVAKQTGELETYEFIYHATSRFVHFSITELLRRAWGNPGTISINSEQFQDYWGHFALYWGLKLFINTAVAITPHLCINAEIDEVDFLGGCGTHRKCWCGVNHHIRGVGLAVFGRVNSTVLRTGRCSLARIHANSSSCYSCRLFT